MKNLLVVLLLVVSINTFAQDSDSLFNQGMELMKNKKYVESITYFKKHLQYNPNDVIAYNAIGAAYVEMKLYDRAMEYFEKSITINSNNSEGYSSRGAMYLLFKRKSRKRFGEIS